jgi:NTE family protein
MDSQLHSAPKIGLAPHVKPIRKSHRSESRPPFQCISLVLQGGGALDAYQAGVYQALAEADLHPDWIAGISIGAINAALIAGNPPAKRVERLREFWEGVTTASPLGWGSTTRPGNGCRATWDANYSIL